MKLKEHIRHDYFVIQWHLTERCNWQCLHCYQEKREFKELSYSEIKNVFKQCLDLFQALHIPREMAHINIGGGEPLLREDLFKILSLFKNERSRIIYKIMTNGSLITDSIAKRLSVYGVSGVQVSLEGLEEHNDMIRGKGSFKKAIAAIRLLQKHNISVRVSITLTRINLDEIEDLAVYLKSLGVKNMGIRRYVPEGRGIELRKFMLSPQELREFYLKRERLKDMFDKKGDFSIPYGCEDGIFLSQAYLKQNHYVCGVVKGHHLNIFTNGDILACRRFPIVLGNVLKRSLLEVYFSSPELACFRDLHNAHPLCLECRYFKGCLGGAKCVTYAYFKNPSAPDPQCWKLFKKLPDPTKFRIRNTPGIPL